jgi:antitoxin ParD1/3/4
MSLRLPERWESFVKSQVESGRFTSGEEVMGEALKLLEARIRRESETLEAIRRGLEDVDAGRVRPLDEVMADLRREFGSPEAS